MPFFGTSEDCVQITWDSDRVIYAHKVDDYVPVFREQIRFGGDGLHRALAAGESAPAAPAEVPAPAVPAEDPPLPPPVAPPPADPGEGSGADDEGDEDAPTKAQRLITEAQSLEHRLTHMPKNPYCDVCSRSRMLKKRTARTRYARCDDELDPVDEFGQRIGSRYVNAVGSEFGGMKLQLGQLVYYRLDPAYREKFQASAAPGVFAGWRFDSGPSSFREVYHVLDYGKLKNREPGYEKAISVPREEIHVPRGNPILPMFTAAEAALSSFTKAEYEAIEFLDVPFSTVAPSTPVAKRHEYITLDRLMRLGATPGCKACKFDGTVHTPVCKARFDGLIKAEKIAASKSVRDAAPPDVERPDPSAESAPAAPEGDEDAPERASSSAGPRAPAGVVVQSSENKVSTGEFGLSARQPEWIDFASKHELSNVACVSGNKAITIASNSRRVLEHFAKVSTKESSEINATSIKAYEFADLVIQSLFPQRYFKSVPNLGKASALITKNLSRREWQAEPKALEAIAQEAEGLRRNGTWDDTTAMPLHELRSQARMPEYAEQIVQTYCEITGTTPDKLRRVNTPCIAESSMTDEDISAQGELHDSASRILMRCLWLARLCRADIAFAVTRLASRVTRWTAWEDRQVLRLVSYIHHTRDVCMNASCSWDAAPELRVYTDADFAACPYTSRSTSGIVVHIGTGQHAFPVMWQSRKQTSVARSTPEAEMISMASAMFSEVINLQTFLQSAFKSTVPIIFFQDNETVLAILKSGYSPKLRHLGRVHRVNVASMAEIFEQEEFSATYVNSKEQLANGLTKIIPPAEWSDMLTQLCLHEGVPHSATVSKVVAEEAERFASSLPRKITQEDLVQLLSYLPGESAVRPSASEAMCFTTGAFAHGGFAVLRMLTRPKSQGFIWHFVKGARNSPQGDRMQGALYSARSRAPILGGNFAVWGGTFSSFDCSLQYVRRQDDHWNAIASGFLTGGVLAARGGWKAASRNAVIGGVLLAIIEGVAALLMRSLSKTPREQAIEAMEQERQMKENPNGPFPTWLRNPMSPQPQAP
ncbi:TIM17 [Symbiodinium sp. CCMP2592]|nr:TIM17 [Symbiodinium sp. CCMP2592]